MRAWFALLLFVCPLAAQAQGLHNGGCAAPTPCGIVAAPRFINVYWGSDLDAYDPNGPSTTNVTSDRIDAFLGALVHSKYFDDASQYGVGSAEMLPSIVVTPGVCPGVPIPQTVGDDRTDGKEAHGLADDLVDCLLTHYPNLDDDRTVFNLILAPSVKPIAADGWCNGGASADHWRYDGIPVTFLPRSTDCGAGKKFSVFARIMTHEMIEAVTDANPWWGWTENWAGSDYFGEEAADICNGSAVTYPPGPSQLTFMGDTLGVNVGTYWNNAVHGCTAGFGIGEPAVFGKLVKGSGKKMEFHVQGNFGGQAPWDLASNQHSAEGGMGTLYVSAEVTGAHTWKAGNFWRPGQEDLVGFKQISWTVQNDQDFIDITGFDGFYQVHGNRSISPGDTITLSITNTRTGQPRKVVFTAPPASSFGTFAVLPPSPSPNHWTFFEDASTVVGSLVDINGGPVENLAVTIQTSAGNFVTPQKTGPDGTFSLPLHTAHAGPATVHMISPVDKSIVAHVHPVADFLAPQQGDAVGGNVVTLTGAGFLAGHTSATVRCVLQSVAATNVSVNASATSVQFTMPPSPCGAGTVQVVVSVDGERGLPLSYTYIVPDQPVLTYLPGCPLGASNAVLNFLEVDAFKADGSQSNEQIQLDAPYNAFQFGSQHTLVIDANHKVNFNGLGPVTATPIGKPQLAVTRSFAQPPTPDCNRGPLVFGSPLQFDPGGPVESVNVNPVIAEGEVRGTESVSWAVPPAEGRFPTAMVQLQGSLAGATSALVTVRGLGANELARIFSTHSTLVSDRRGVQARLFGTPFRVDARLSRESPQLMGVFRKERGVQVQVVWAGDEPGSAWMPIKSALAEDPGMITFPIQAPGVYALAAVEARK